MWESQLVLFVVSRHELRGFAPNWFRSARLSWLGRRAAGRLVASCGSLWWSRLSSFMLTLTHYSQCPQAVVVFVSMASLFDGHPKSNMMIFCRRL